MMRKILCIVFALLLLCGCKQRAPEYTDVNLEVLQSYANYHIGAEIVKNTYDEQQEIGYATEWIHFSDKETILKIVEEINARLGYRIASPLKTEPEEPLWRYTEITALVESEPDAVYCTVGLINSSKNIQVSFLLKGKDTPQAAYVRVGTNFSWYTFEDPVGFVKLFWDETQAVSD